MKSMKRENIKNNSMEKEQKPKATQKEFDQLVKLEEMDALDFINSYRWYPEIVYEGDKCGIVSVLGKVVLPTEFEDIKFFASAIEKQSVATAQKNGKWGLVKTYTGESVTGFIYDYMPPVSANIIPGMKNGKWWYIKNTGELFTPMEFDMIFTDNGVSFMNGISIFKKDGRYGVTDGLEISKPVFDEIDIVELDEFISGTRDGIRGYIDQEGEFTADEEKAYWIGDCS